MPIETPASWTGSCRCWEETLRLRKAILGADHLDMVNSMASMAEGYRAAGKLDRALAAAEGNAAALHDHFGLPNHPHTLTSMNNLATCYWAVGKLDQALPLLEETLRLRKTILGAKHPDTLGSMTNLATGYQDAGKLDRALAVAGRKRCRS